MRLIDADDIVYESIDSEDTNRYAYYYGTGIMAIRKEDIDAMATIEPERKTGRWIVKPAPDKYHAGEVMCPFCKTELIADPDEYLYCPGCGARLEGVE